MWLCHIRCFVLTIIYLCNSGPAWSAMFFQNKSIFILISRQIFISFQTWQYATSFQATPGSVSEAFKNLKSKKFA